MANKTYSFFSFCGNIVIFFGTVITVVCSICDVGERELMNVFAGSTVRFSFDSSCITKEMDTIRWRFRKQDSESNNLIVEYHFNGNHPVVELEKFKGRAEFDATDYSLTVSEIVYDDEGTYIVEARNKNDGRISTVKNSVLIVTGTQQSIHAFAGTTVTLSVNGAHIPCNVDTFRWRFDKQNSENYSMIVEYSKGLTPVIELQTLKGRAIFSTTDYSLIINEIQHIDSGSYTLEARHSSDGKIDRITLIILNVEDMQIPQDSNVSSFTIAVIVSFILGAATTVAVFFLFFWNQNLLQKSPPWIKDMTTKLIKRWMILYTKEDIISLARQEEQQRMVTEGPEEEEQPPMVLVTAGPEEL